MGVPTSEVGFTPAMPRREDHEVHKDMSGDRGGAFILKSETVETWIMASENGRNIATSEFSLNFTIT